MKVAEGIDTYWLEDGVHHCKRNTDGEMIGGYSVGGKIYWSDGTIQLIKIE